MIAANDIEAAFSELKFNGKNPDYFAKARDVFSARLDDFVLDRETINMILQMNNFGDVLISRPAGREAFLAASAYILKPLKKGSEIILDFADVQVLAPSWVDEFILNIRKKYYYKYFIYSYG